MSDDYNSAGIAVGHNMHILRLLIIDLVSGFNNSADEHRFISAEKEEIRNAIADLSQLLEQIERADTSRRVPVDPREGDPSREGIFRFHNCWRCRDGKLKCAQGNPLQCSLPHARND